MPRKIKLTEMQIGELQTAAMYGEPVGGHMVYLFVEEPDYYVDRLSCGCCECCGCDCWMDDVEGDYFYDDDYEEDE